MGKSTLFTRTRGKEDRLTSILFGFMKFVTEEKNDTSFLEKFENSLKSFESEESSEIELWPSLINSGAVPDVIIKNSSSILVIENKLDGDFNPDEQLIGRDLKLSEDPRYENYTYTLLRISNHTFTPDSIRKYVEEDERIEWIPWRRLYSWIKEYSQKIENCKEIEFLCRSLLEYMEEENLDGFGGFTPEDTWFFVVSHDRIGNLAKCVDTFRDELLEYLSDGERSVPFRRKGKTLPAPDGREWKRWVRSWFYIPIYPEEISEDDNFGRSHVLFAYFDFRSAPVFKVGIRINRNNVKKKISSASLAELENIFQEFVDSSEHDAFTVNNDVRNPLPLNSKSMDKSDRFVVVTKQFEWNRLMKSKLDKEELFEDIYNQLRKFYKKFENFLEAD